MSGNKLGNELISTLSLDQAIRCMKEAGLNEYSIAIIIESIGNWARRHEFNRMQEALKLWPPSHPTNQQILIELVEEVD